VTWTSGVAGAFSVANKNGAHKSTLRGAVFVWPPIFGAFVFPSLPSFFVLSGAEILAATAALFSGYPSLIYRLYPVVASD
jgi:hypothetical protein